jgi:hypothetical protein
MSPADIKHFLIVYDIPSAHADVRSTTGGARDLAESQGVTTAFGRICPHAIPGDLAGFGWV